MNLLKLSLYEDFFYSKNNLDKTEEKIIFLDGTVLYRTKNVAEFTVKSGTYIFCQERVPFSENFIQENKTQLEAFAKNKNIKLDWTNIFFRTLKEDNLTAYQFWMGTL